MIFIISNDSDQSTNLVIKWLLRFNQKVIRVGQEKFVSSIDILISDSKTDLYFDIDGQRIAYSEITGFWYRKHLLHLLPNVIHQLSKNEYFDHETYADHLINEELKIIYDYIIFLLEQKRLVGNLQAKNGNKLISFYHAKQMGFKIPETFVSSDLASLKKQHEKLTQVVTKPVQDLYYESESDTTKANYIDLTADDLFEQKSATIFPSCIQAYIDKKVEIRTFYLHGETYSMTIFSQNDEQTKIDFRNYNDEKPNRMLPFQLPKAVENKVDLFMKSVGLNAGSLDLILTHENEFVFLEVNPAGQYGMIQNACNFGLDKRIAERLTA